MLPASVPILISLPALAVVVLLLVSKRRRRPGQESGPAVRSANLDPAVDGGRTWWSLSLLATAIPIAGTTTLLALRWQAIPKRFPVHWGISGQPDRWADRSLSSTFGFLLLACVVVLGMGLLGEVIARSSPGHKGRAAMIGTARTVLVACSWFMTVLLCAVSLLPLAHDPTNLVPFLVLGCSVFSLGILAYAVYRWTQIPDAVTASQNTTDARFWKAGLIYFNPADSALMVPKRMGFGYTMNFGRPASWLILGAILLPLLLPLLMHVSSRR